MNSDEKVPSTILRCLCNLTYFREIDKESNFTKMWHEVWLRWFYRYRKPAGSVQLQQQCAVGGPAMPWMTTSWHPAESRQPGPQQDHKVPQNWCQGAYVGSEEVSQVLEGWCCFGSNQVFEQDVHLPTRPWWRKTEELPGALAQEIFVPSSPNWSSLNCYVCSVCTQRVKKDYQNTAVFLMTKIMKLMVLPSHAHHSKDLQEVLEGDGGNSRGWWQFCLISWLDISLWTLLAIAIHS